MQFSNLVKFILKVKKTLDSALFTSLYNIVENSTTLTSEMKKSCLPNLCSKVPQTQNKFLSIQFRHKGEVLSPLAITSAMSFDTVL